MNFSGKFAHLIPESRKYADCLFDVASNVIDAYQSVQDVRNTNHTLLTIPDSSSSFTKCNGKLMKYPSNSHLNLIPDKTLVKSKSMILLIQGKK
uniref:Uncharacterized protein n=1 Tax=Strongyloides papillosus TaxID=174720 RepID=A0A0N5C747_STREA